MQLEGDRAPQRRRELRVEPAGAGDPVLFHLAHDRARLALRRIPGEHLLCLGVGRVALAFLQQLHRLGHLGSGAPRLRHGVEPGPGACVPGIEAQPPLVRGLRLFEGADAACVVAQGEIALYLHRAVAQVVVADLGVVGMLMHRLRYEREAFVDIAGLDQVAPLNEGLTRAAAEPPEDQCERRCEACQLHRAAVRSRVCFTLPGR